MADSTQLGAMANSSIEIISNILEQAAKIAEEQVDAKLSQLNEMDEDELEKLKEKRLEALKKAQKQKQVSLMFSESVFVCKNMAPLL